MGSIISSCWDLVERLSSSGNLYSFLLLWPGNQWVKIFIRFLSFTGLYCLNSHAPVEVGILLIFCIRDTDTYPIFVSIFIIFNYGHNSETLWGHCYELSNFLMVQICLETSLDESQGTIMYIGCRYNYIRSWTLKGPMTYILQSYYNGSVPFVWSYFIYWLDCCHVWLQFALLMSSLWACFGVNINLHFFSMWNWSRYVMYRKSHFGGCNSYSSGGGQLNCLHFLGCKEGPWFQFPWSLPVRRSHGPHGVFTNPGWIAVPWSPWSTTFLWSLNESSNY